LFIHITDVGMVIPGRLQKRATKISSYTCKLFIS